MKGTPLCRWRRRRWRSRPLPFHGLAQTFGPESSPFLSAIFAFNPPPPRRRLLIKEVTDDGTKQAGSGSQD